MENNQNMEDLSILYPQETNNGLNMDDYSQFQSNINPSTFNNFPNSTFTINSSETAYINRVIGENDFPYPNINNIEEKRDIPIIEISKIFLMIYSKKINKLIMIKKLV